MMNENKEVYVSKVAMSNDRYKDVMLITFAKYTAFMQVIGVVYLLFYVYQMVGGKNYELLCLDSGLLLVLAVMMFFSLKTNKIEKFEKSFTMEDGTYMEYVTTFFEDKIAVNLSSGISAEYTYDQVKGIKSGGKLYFLEMAKDFHIVVDKELSGCEDRKEFEAYIIEKCQKMREKRVVGLEKSEGSFKEIMIMLAASLIVAVAFQYFM